MSSANRKIRKINSLLGMTLVICISATAYAAKDQCADAVTTELGLLDMGTYAQPADSVIRKDNAGLTWEDATVFKAVGQTVVISNFMSGGRRIVVASKSVAFGGSERKEINLNQNCQIQSLKLVANSNGVELSPKLCLAIEASRATSQTRDELNAAVKNIEPGSYWSQSPFLIDVVLKQCLFYKDKFASY